MMELNFQRELEKYFIAYDQIDDHEWLFFLNDFPVRKIQIKSIPIGKSRHLIYKGITDIELHNPPNNRFSSPSWNAH